MSDEITVESSEGKDTVTAYEHEDGSQDKKDGEAENQQRSRYLDSNSYVALD